MTRDRLSITHHIRTAAAAAGGGGGGGGGEQTPEDWC